jgi:plastocyanin
MNRSRLSPPAAAVITMCLALAACSGPSAGGSASASAAGSDAGATGGDQVRIEFSAFDPGELTVPVGTEVVFVNVDSFPHTVTHGTDGEAVEDPYVDEEIGGGAEVSVIFDEAGTYDITCRIHPAMQMTVTVEG